MNNKEKGDKGELFVHNLAFKSFLRYWCYPNPKDEKGDHKEICDLLVLFKNVCLIISVKNHKSTKNHVRYNSKTLGKAERQLNGAFRKLFNTKREIYIKHPDRNVELFELHKYTSIHKIVVNLGNKHDVYPPGIFSKNNFIGVFDKNAFEVLMKELNTISDFIEYFNKREALLKSDEPVIIKGAERDLIAVYLKNYRGFPKEFTINGYDVKILDIDGQWESFIKNKNPQREAKIKADKSSYFIDDICQYFLNTLPKGHVFSEELLQLNRFKRRILSDVFKEFYQMHYKNKPLYTGHRYFEIDSIGFVLLYLSPDLMTESFSEGALFSAIVGYSIHTKYKAKNIIGICTSHKIETFKFQFRNSDVPFDSIELKAAKGVIKELGWFKNIKITNSRISEYPE